MNNNHHSHTHWHNHIHGTKNIAVAFFLNVGFAIIELIGGVLTNSVAIMSDALHDFGDSLSLGTAWYFQKKSQQNRTQNYTYGYKRFSLVGAFINSIVLLIGSIFIIQEAIGRLLHPVQPNPEWMIALAILWIAINWFAALRLKKGDSINEKVVSLHLLEDVLWWVAVLIGAWIMMFVNAPIIDPILSLAIATYVLFNVYRNIKPAFRIILQGMPDSITENEVRRVIMEENNVIDIHDFHLWTLDGKEHILSIHVTVKNDMNLQDAEQLKENVKNKLKRIDIAHATIEIEYNPQHCVQQDC